MNLEPIAFERCGSHLGPARNAESTAKEAAYDNTIRPSLRAGAKT